MREESGSSVFAQANSRQPADLVTPNSFGGTKRPIHHPKLSRNSDWKEAVAPLMPKKRLPRANQPARAPGFSLLNGAFMAPLFIISN